MWAKKLTAWYLENQRDLPWRINPSPYKTLICEFMAQQTQIKTLLPYFTRWIEQYPSVKDVAVSKEDKILKSWEGLGYYSRARNLHKTCQIIEKEYGGKIPNTSSELLKLPGIGPYIAAAISSISFNESIAVVDGNVLRVITRLFGLRDDITKEKTKQAIQKRLNREIRNTTPGVFNQAIMELGALICKPKSPHCELCPINSICYANNMNEIEKLPYKPKKAPIPHYTIAVGVIRKENGEILITKRKKDQLLGGLWEFPGGKVKSGETLEAALIREIKEEVNLNIYEINKIGKVNHAYSHFKITMHAFECKSENFSELKCKSADEYKFIKSTEFKDYAFPKANKVIIENLINRG